MLIVLTMLVGMAPANLFAITATAEEVTDPQAATAVGDTLVVKGDSSTPANPANVPGTHWEKADSWRSTNATCGKDEHTHTDKCYKTPDITKCSHHIESTLAGHPDTCTVANMDDPCTKKICFSSHKTVNGTKYHVKFECQHTHTRDCYTLGCSNALSGEHTHSEPACYSYTWKLVWNTYNVTVTTSGKDDVTKEQIDVLTSSVQHSVGEFSCVVPAMGEIGWVATVMNDGVEKTSVSLSADATTTVTTKNLTSGAIEIKFSRATVYNVTLTNATPELGQASLNVTEAIKGTVITVTATPNANTDNTKYSLASITANGVDITESKTYTVGEENIEVVVTFAKEQLSGNPTATIKFNGGKTAANQLDALKQEIFNKLAINYFPDGITYDTDGVKYEHKYYETYSISGNVIGGATQNSQSQPYVEIGVDPADRDVTVGYYTTHPFGYTGIGTVEHVRISYNGLVIEADVTLEESRPTVVTWIDGNGVELKKETLDSSVTPSYTGDTPTKSATVSETYTFAGWGDPVVSGDANYVYKTYTAAFEASVRIYEISWDTDGDGDIDTVTNVAYGTVPTEPTPADLSSENKSFAGWSSAIVEVTGAATYKAMFTNDTIYTVTFMVDGEKYGDTQYINVTREGKVARPQDPDKEYAVFVGWDLDIIGKTPSENNIVVNALWGEDINNNNVLDSAEKVAVAPVLPEGQSGVTVTVDGMMKDDDGNFVFNSNEIPTGGYSVTYTPPVAVSQSTSVKNYISYFAIYDANGELVFSVGTKNGVAAIADVEADKYSYNDGALTVNGLSLDVLANGHVEIEYAEHKIEANGNKEVSVNGYNSTTIYESLTKGNVLQAILGDFYDPARIGEYTVTMTVGLAMIKDKLGVVGSILPDTFEADVFSDRYELLGIDITTYVKEILKGAFDINETEAIKVTWRSTEIGKPEVSANYTIKLRENRPSTTVTHNGGTYNMGSINGLLDLIKGNLTSNVVISDVDWAEDYTNPVFVPGTTMTLKVKVTVIETAEFCGKEHVVEVTVYVPYTSVNATFSDNRDLIYNTGMSDADKSDLVLGVLDPKFNVPLVGVSPVVWYLASTEHTVPMEINFSEMDLGVYGTIIKNLLGNSITIQVPVKEMWLNIGDDLTIPEAPSNDLIESILLNDLIPEYGAQFMAGQLTSEAMQAILADTLKKYPEIEQYYKYLGAHQFGELEQETVKITVAAFGDYGGYDSGAIVLNLTDTRTETEIKLNSGVTVVYGQYTAEQLMQLILNGVYANGEKIDGLTVKFEKNVIGLPAGEGITVTVQFKGDRLYKPSESTVTITIEKAPVTVTVDNQVVKYGDAFNKLPVTTNPANVDLIQFIVGLDISGVNINGGIKGLNGKVQLLLPEELQDTLAMVGDLIGVDLSHGATIKLSDFEDVLEKLDSLSGIIGYEEYLSVLSNMLNTLPVDSITDIADLEITIGGSLPTNAGVYLIGAVTADANYETAFGVGVLVLYPDGIKADIAWNQDDSNYIITNSLLASGKFDLGAHAFQVGQDGNLADATAQIMNLFLGVDIEGNLVFVTDGKNLNVGAYVELALIVNWGNQIYYSNILVRPIIVVAESLDVEFADQNGTVNNDRHFEFDNTPQSGMQEDGLKVTYKQDGNGYKAGDAVENYTVRYYYVGVQTNGTPYYGTAAPTHAGVYAITAVVIVYDADGSISHAGQKIGVLVIEPSKSNVTVDNSAIKYEDGKVNYVNGLVKPSSVNVPGLKPDTTIISVGLSANLDAINGLSSINGTVNIDLPGWLDEVLKKYNLLEAGYDTGITAGTFASYIETLKAKLADLGIDAAALDKIAGIVNQIPVTTNLTFKDNVGYTEVGAYLIIAVVTDSDHYPSAAAGVMVIYPDATKVDLGFDKTWDDNNVFTQNYLNVYDLNAKAYLNGALHEDASALVTNIFVGFADDGRLILTKNKAELDNGIYAQVAFLLDIGNELYYAEPISRVFVIVPNGADVDFVDGNGNINNDRHFEFNNNAHTMGGVRVELVDGTVLTNPDGIDIFYIGVQTNGKAYASKNAPVHAGVYEVVVQYTGRDAQNRVVNLGANIGTMVIEPSKSEVSVDNSTVVYEEGKLNHVNGLVHSSSVNVPGLKPDTTIISVGLSANLDTISGLSSINGTVNVDLPGWLDALLEQYGLLEAGRNAGITAETFLDYINRLKTELAALGTYSEDIVGALDKLAGIVEELPISTNLTFKDNVGYTEVGAYLIIAIVTDSDHYPSVATGFMVIKPNTTKVELNWSYSDSNNIFTWHTLNGVDLDAKANKAEANEFVENIYFGFTSKGEFIFTQDWRELDNGAYCQIAFVADFGNEAYYAEPIGRVFAIIPTPADIVISDGATSGNHFEFTYNGNPQGVNVSVSVVGTPVDLGDVSIKYVGVMSNGELYESTVAPTRAGVYAVSVTYVVRDGQGRIVTLGEKIATFIIKPATADVDVENKLWESNGSAFDINGMITATPNVGMTVITSAIKTDGTFSENWLGALTGSVNIDLPDWADALLLEVGFTGGSVAGLIAAIDAIEAKFDTLTAELGLDLEIGAFDAIRNLLNQMDRNLNVTINDNANPDAIGAYLVMAIVTDPNYLPAIDAGVLVIYPKANEVDLNWNYNDDNDIFSMGVLGNEELMGATPSGGDSTVKVVYIGFDLENMKLIITGNGATLATGTYIQLAYLVPALNSEFDYAKFLARPIIAVPNTHEVEVTVPGDAHEDVDYEISIEIDGQDAATATGTITITYVGLTASGELYESATAPTKAGTYVVTVTYLTRDGNGNVNGMGADVTTLVITGHVDENTDHKCDFENCTKDDMHMDGHVDSATDDDHVCDYGCGAVLENCVDAEKDHECDICGGNVGTHADSATDDDHVCDYGCGAVLEAHDFDIVKHETEDYYLRKCHICGYFNEDDRYQFGGVSGGDLKDEHLVTEELKNNDRLNTVEKIEQVLAENLENLIQTLNPGEHLSATLYDVTLRYWDASVNDFVKADRDHFPADGKMTVTIPLNGIVSDELSIYVIHLFGVTDPAHGTVAGEYETFTVGNGLTVTIDEENNQTLLIFTVSGLSPIMIGFGCVEHTDDNHDHKCDHVGCTFDAIGDHEDDDTDHKCDYCGGGTFGEHKDDNKDHACDYGCQVTMGTCADGNKDHACDYGCDRYFGEHKDADKNHACDYGCQVTMGTCADGNKDHACDYGCDRYFGEHKDADKDHACDYGCSEAIGGHVDVNKDHACDYGCQVAIGDHEDDDTDHKCDYCGGGAFGEHKDDNKDHVCDYGCSEAIGEHKDNDKDHNCDYCDGVLSNCTDADKDHKCDECGTTISSCNDSRNEHICDICGRKLNDCVDGNKDHECDYDGCTNDTLGVHADSNHDHKCDYCGGVMGTCAEGNVIDHKCDYCGKGSFGGAHAEGSVIDHKCDYCGKGSFGVHAEGDVLDHKCDYCEGVISACADSDKNHVCDVCGVVLDECADENKDNVCDVCGEEIEEDKTGILILLMLLIVLMVVFCIGTTYCLVHSKKTSRAARRATKPVATVTKKKVASAPVVVPRAEAKTPVAEPKVEVETAVEVSEEEAVLPATDAKADEAVAAEDTAAAKIAPATVEKASAATVKKGTVQASTTKKLVKIARKGAPVALSALVAAVAAVALYKVAKKKQKSKIVELIVKFFR